MRRTSRVIPVTLLGLLPPTACGPTITADFNSAEPAARNAAIVEAAAHNDHAAVPDLVRMLDSDDPATRLLAINALEKITGERLGYEYTAPEHERVQAADRWQEWVQQHHGKQTSALTPSSSASPSHRLTISPSHEGGSR